MSVFAALKIPKILYKTESKYNGVIEVFEVGSTRKLVVDGFNQSVNPDSQIAERLVWGHLVKILQEQEPNLKNVLILGLGGGTIQHMIAQRFPGVAITSVEIDQVMVDVGRNFFDLDKISNHTVIIADALRVVVDPQEYELDPQSFQAVIVDIYIGEKYPDLGSSGNFAAAVKNMAIPNGLVIYNRMYHETHQEEVNTFTTFLEGFLTDVQTYVVAGYTNSDNIVIYGRAQFV